VKLDIGGGWGCGHFISVCEGILMGYGLTGRQRRGGMRGMKHRERMEWEAEGGWCRNVVVSGGVSSVQNCRFGR